MESSLQNNKGMTFVEMLVVIAIISILFASFFYIWNTMDIFRKSRDSRRINDLQLLDSALKTLLSTERNINLGQENVIYTSLPDSSSTCGSYNLIPLFYPYSYRCQTSQNYLKVDGQGWLPVNFTLGKILMVSVLPIDPLNNKDYFYAYQVRQGRYKLTARFENQVNISKMANDGGFEPTLYEVGSDLFMPSPHSGLVGYWNFDEGTGTVAYDLSGYDNNGTLINFNWTATSGWITGKAGKALSFDGVNDYVDCGNGSILPFGNSPRTLCGWAKLSAVPTNWQWIISYGTPTVNQASFIGFGVFPGQHINFGGYGNDLKWFVNLQNYVDKWVFICGVYTGNLAKLYVDGDLKTQNSFLWNTVPYMCRMGRQVNNFAEFLSGLIDEVRLYNRALSDVEIQALYNATK